MVVGVFQKAIKRQRDSLLGDPRFSKVFQSVFLVGPIEAFRNLEKGGVKLPGYAGSGRLRLGTLFLLHTTCVGFSLSAQ
jgi:hypothetical protein